MESQQTSDSHVGSQKGVLATDLDGTLIPLEGNSDNQSDLKTLAEELQKAAVRLIYITGRHFESAVDAMEQFGLPAPDWLVCDVGTSMYQRAPNVDASQEPNALMEFRVHEAYQRELDGIIEALPIQVLRQHLDSISGLRLQEPEKQGRFKLSFYAEASQLDDLVDKVQQTLQRLDAPYSTVSSVDPFNGDGLVDLLPATVTKAYALAWWVKQSGVTHKSVVFAGDSGNDVAALTAGYRAIVVGNADRAIAGQVQQAHQNAGWEKRLFLARGHATSGVLEGCRNFGLV